jgi:hypothetical protein
MDNAGGALFSFATGATLRTMSMKEVRRYPMPLARGGMIRRTAGTSA